MNGSWHSPRRDSIPRLRRLSGGRRTSEECQRRSRTRAEARLPQQRRQSPRHQPPGGGRTARVEIATDRCDRTEQPRLSTRSSSGERSISGGKEIWSVMAVMPPERSHCHPAHVRSEIEFGEPRACARKSRTHRSDRDAEGEGRVVVGQLHPDTENKTSCSRSGVPGDGSSPFAPGARRRDARQRSRRSPARPGQAAICATPSRTCAERRWLRRTFVAMPYSQGTTCRAAAPTTTPPGLQKDDLEQFLRGRRRRSAEAVVEDQLRRGARTTSRTRRNHQHANVPTLGL